MPAPVLGSALKSASPYPRAPPFPPVKPIALVPAFWITKAMPSAPPAGVNWNWKLVVNPFLTTCGLVYHAEPVWLPKSGVSCNTNGLSSPPTTAAFAFGARHVWFELKSGVYAGEGGHSVCARACGTPLTAVSTIKTTKAHRMVVENRAVAKKAFGMKCLFIGDSLFLAEREDL